MADYVWPWEVGNLLQDTIGMVAMIVLAGIVAILGILILTGKIPLPGGVLGRLAFGFGAIIGGAYILLEVAA